MSPKRFFLILSIAAALSVAADGFYFFKSTANFQAKQSQLRKTRADILIHQNQADDFLKLEQTFQTDVSPKLDLVNKALPSEKNEGAINQAISDLARQTGVSLSGEGVSFAASTANATNIVPVSFSVAGRYSQIQNFLQGMETLDRQNDIISVGLGNQAGQITAALTVNMYIRP